MRAAQLRVRWNSRGWPSLTGWATLRTEPLTRGLLPTSAGQLG